MIRANHNRTILNRICRASCALGLLIVVTALPTFAQQIHQLSSNGTSWTEQNLNGASTGARGIAAYLTTPNDQKHVYYLSSGPTPDIHQLFFNGVSWTDEDLTVLSGAAPALQFSAVTGFSVGNYQYVYYLGPSNHLHQSPHSSSPEPRTCASSTLRQAAALSYWPPPTTRSGAAPI